MTEEQKKQASSEDVEVPEKFTAIIDAIERMSVLDLNELVRVLEKKFGVSAAALSMAALAPGARDDSVPGGEEKSTYTVELKDGGAQKIAVIKVLKEALGLGLKEAKDKVDGVPTVLKEGVKKVEAEELKKKIEEAGGKVVLK